MDQLPVEYSSDSIVVLQEISSTEIPVDDANPIGDRRMSFEPVNGIAVTGFAILNKYNALPNLNLGVDDQGYIYVKQPTFEFDKNGVIGAGRDVFHCTDPQEYNQFYNANQFSTRDKIKSILLADPRIQKIVSGNSCEFMADGTLYAGNGTYRTINVNLNNTKELSASIDLQGWSVISYQLGNLTAVNSGK